MRRFPINHEVTLETNEVLRDGSNRYFATFIMNTPRGAVNIQADITSDEAFNMTQIRAEQLYEIYKPDLDVEYRQINPRPYPDEEAIETIERVPEAE